MIQLLYINPKRGIELSILDRFQFSY